ncbi:MAG: LacI family DNA-binding transcriptional regulator, partial [Lachnospiraceae bacterium]|nr:LacI family DNA-binding transcriptional regulator [Lachnospiraceae bacterium]
MSKTVKIGVLVSDATSAEALGRRSYLEDYIQGQYNVEFVYSDELKDAAGEKSAVDTMITNNCKAIISESSFDRPAQIEQCEDAGVYYAVAAGTLTSEEYDTYKTYEYYVGATGPSLDIEYQTGYDMAKYYLDQGKTNFTIFGGAVAYRTEMHVYRVAGMLMAMIEAGGADASYQGLTDAGAIIGQLMADGEVKTGDIGTITVSGYLGGYDMDDAWFAKGAEMVQASGVEVLLAVGSGADFFGTAAAGTDVKIASVDAYADNYAEAMDAGTLDYMAGKFSAYDAPIFIAVYRAALGAPLRNNDGNALAIDQGYWVSTDAAGFRECLAADTDKENPVYTKDELDPLLDADYDTFEAFVENYDFDAIK